MISKNELFQAAKRVYLNYINDEDRSQLTPEEAEALLRLIDEIPSLVSANVPDGIYLEHLVGIIVDGLIKLFPRFSETQRELEKIEDREGYGQIKKSH